MSIRLSISFLTVLFAFESSAQITFDLWQQDSFTARIAYSADGNYNDEDDWASSPMALAIFAEFSVQSNLVHFDYNCILPKSNSAWEREHTTSITGAIEHFEYNPDIFYDCQTDLDGAINSIARAIDASSADNPLFFILAGPMEVPYMGIARSSPEKRKYVYCISHNRWNDGYASADLVDHNKRDVIPTGITWVQIRDQNPLLTTSPFGRPSNEAEWEPWQWLRNSDNKKLNFLWERLRVSTRGDCSDAGMAYFLMTGDEQADLAKLRALLEGHEVPSPFLFRDQIRLEAENFTTLEDLDVDFVNNREVSQRISVKSKSHQSRLSTLIREPYMIDHGTYHIDIRYSISLSSPVQFTLKIDGWPIARWEGPTDPGWTTETIPQIQLSQGETVEILISNPVAAEIHLDYVQLNRKHPFAQNINANLDDAEAQPGQIVVAGDKPGYLKYNGGGPVFLCGPDNPEDFLYRGTLLKDGTREGGGQEEMIRRLAQSGVNAFHCQMFRMQRCNFKNEGNDLHAPFNEHDPHKGLNQAVLDQWDKWISLLEQYGIAIHLEFYNDATDVSMMGWGLDNNGNLHAEEHDFIEGIVSKFMHHKNILWGIEESCNKLPRSMTPYFKKIAQLIADTDRYHHPIVQSFVIPGDPEGDFQGGGGTPDDYIDDPNIEVVTWLHIEPHDDDYEAQHQRYLYYRERDSRDFIVMKNETYHHPRKGAESRRYMWSATMAGLHNLEAYHHADNTMDTTLREDGLIRRFMEQTEFYRLQPRDALAYGSTKWVLARPGQAYIAYTYAYDEEMGIKGLVPGQYDLLWFDTITGEQSLQLHHQVLWGDHSWTKPETFSDEIAIYLQRK